MNFSVKVVIFVFLLSTIAFSQELSREQKLQKIEELKSEVKSLEKALFQPDEKDLTEAQKEGVEVFRLMPRERYDGRLIIQGGGAYYSFTTRSHDYQKTAQIELQQNNLSVGFAGADYGFITDLGTLSLSSVTEDTNDIDFLVNYRPPTKEREVRIEQKKALNPGVGNPIYSSRMPATIGHTFALRAINFGDADVLVALKIHRIDADGSLIIFWKKLKNFEKPFLARN